MEFMPPKALLEFFAEYDPNAKVVGTPLMLAVKDNDEETVRNLLKADTPIDLVEDDGKTILEKISLGLIKNSSIPGALLMKLVEKCETVEEVADKLFKAKCPFHVAVLLKNIKLTKIFLEREIKKSGNEEPWEASALHIAVHFHDLEGVKLLLEHGFDVNIKDASGCTPVMYFRESEHCKEEHLKILKLLLDRGADLTNSSAGLLGYLQLYSIFHNGSKEAVRLVLQSNVNFGAMDGNCSTPLHYLAANRNPGVFELLQDQIFDANVQDFIGFTPLQTVIDNGNIAGVKVLIDRGADVNLSLRNVTTPLFGLMQKQTQGIEELQCIELLLRHGADVQAVMFQGDTIFHKVMKFKTFELAQPVLAQLAMLEASGIKIKDEVSGKLNKSARLVRSFNKYKRLLDRFNQIYICDSVTMFDLLTEDEGKLVVQLRNHELVLKLDRLSYKNNQDTYCHRKLRERIIGAYRQVQVRIRASVALCKIMKITYDSHPTISDKICNYLNEQDLQKLAQISNVYIGDGSVSDFIKNLDV